MKTHTWRVYATPFLVCWIDCNLGTGSQLSTYQPLKASLELATPEASSAEHIRAC